MKQTPTQQNQQPQVNSSAPVPSAHQAPAVKRPRWKTSMAILVVINIVLLIGIFALIRHMEKSGEELKKLRTEKFVLESQATDAVAEQELESAQIQYQRVKRAFPNENQLLEFVTSLDELKRQGLISSFKFASDTPLKDKNGISGLPISIDLRGSGEQISQGLQALEDLPVILNAVRIEVTTGEDGVKTMEYGGFLYVDQNFSQN